MQVSHSRIECFKKCPYQYKLRYLYKLKTFFNGDPANPLIIGTALHMGIEQSVEEAIKWYYEQYPIVDDAIIEEAIKLEFVIKLCRDILPPGGMFELKLECDEFIGFIDYLVEVEPGVYDMYDFKYSNNIKNYMESGQLHEYKYYFEKLNPGKRIRNMYFLFAPKVAIRKKYKNKTNKRDETLEEFRRRLKTELNAKNAELVQIEYNEEKVKEFMSNRDECLNAQTFDRNPTKLCDWCEYKNFCMNEDSLDIDWEKSGNEKGEINMQLPENKRRSTKPSDKKKMWFYGAPFSGKTFLANKFPEPLMLNTDGNVKFVDAPYVAIRDEVKVEGRLTKRTFAWEVFKDAIGELEKKQNDFKTIIVDLLEDTYEQCRLYMYDQLGITHESDDSFRAWDKIRTEWLSTIKRLMNLDYDNIILISHEDTSKDITKKTGDKVTAIKPNLNEKAALKVAGMVDLVCRIVNDAGTRKINLKNDEVTFGGGRLGIKADEVPCSYDKLMSLYKAAVEAHKPTVEAPVAQPTEEVKPAPVAAEETPAPAVEELPKRKTRTEPTEHEKKVEEFRAEHAQPTQTEETPAPRRRRVRGA